MRKQIWFDMDGTLADFYGVDGWLDAIMAEDPRPYNEARPMVDTSALAELLKELQHGGWELGIISWTAKRGSSAYNKKVGAAKRSWLARELPTVSWDHIHIVDFGTNKHMVCGSGILFDDEIANRNDWGDGAYTPENIIPILKSLAA